MAKWNKATLSELGEIITGNTPKTSDEENYASNDIPFLKPSDFNNDSIDLEKIEFYISEKARNKARILPVGSIAVTCIGIIGKTKIMQEECAFNQQINAVIPFKDNNRYIAYAISFQKELLQVQANAAVVPIINKTEFSKISITLPPLETQRQIAANLDKVTHTIDLCNAILEKLDMLVKSRFVEMFGVGKYPCVKLKTVCSKITDGTHKTPNYLQQGITFISAKNIVNSELDFSDVKYISEDEYNEIQKRCQTEIYDVLLSKSGSLGSPAILKTDKPVGLFESLAIIKYDRNQLIPEFLCEQLKTDDIQRQFKSGTKGISIKHLHLNVIGDIDIIVPPLALQEQFAAFVEQTDKSKLAVKQMLEKAETLKKALMQEYFE